MGKAVTEYTGESAVCFLAFSLTSPPAPDEPRFASNQQHMEPR
jgi:hypothetical protein